MAVIQIDIFQFDNNDGEATEVSVFFDNVSLAITYTVNTGSLSSGSVTALQRGKTDGTSLGDYPNEANTLSYAIVAQLSTPFARKQGEPTPIVSTPPQCDLDLAQSSTNETAQGADDGSVTMTATSSFPNALVSINNTTFFSSPHTLSSLAPGNYVAYAKDDNDCTKSIAFAIEAFNNPISGGFNGGLPQTEVSPGNISRWNAAYNPVVLNFQKTPDPAKKNFRYEIEITSQQGIVTGTWSPNTLGYCRADISAYLQGLVNANDDFNYDVLNYRDLNRAAYFTIRYREVWDGDSSVWYNAPQPLYVTYSAKQLGDIYGGNMAKYVPFFNEQAYENKARFLTGFNEPSAWVGLPFDTSFIFSEYLVTKEVKLRTISLDINRNPISGGVLNSFLLNNDAGYILGSDLGRLIIQQGALPPVSNDGILDQLGINRLMLAGQPANNVHYFAIQLYTGEDNAPNYVTQQLIIGVNKPCKDPYIYIKWLNTLGGWDYWRFGKEQIVSLNTANGIEIDRNVFDWENDETIADVISKTAFERVSFGCIVPTAKAEGLKQLATSVKVQILTNTNPYKWQTVIVNVGQFDIKSTKLGYSELKFTATFPEKNIQRQ